MMFGNASSIGSLGASMSPGYSPAIPHQSLQILSIKSDGVAASTTSRTLDSPIPNGVPDGSFHCKFDQEMGLSADREPNALVLSNCSAASGDTTLSGTISLLESDEEIAAFP